MPENRQEHGLSSNLRDGGEEGRSKLQRVRHGGGPRGSGGHAASLTRLPTLLRSLKRARERASAIVVVSNIATFPRPSLPNAATDHRWPQRERGRDRERDRMTQPNKSGRRARGRERCRGARWTTEREIEGREGAAGKPIKNYMPSNNAPRAAFASTYHTGNESND